MSRITSNSNPDKAVEKEITKPTISLPSGFKFGEVPPIPGLIKDIVPDPSLGPLSAFVGSWNGIGFNTIFRPNSPQTPTQLPSGAAVGDNVLQLNLTSETITFSKSLGRVPNRGMVQADAFLNGVSYLQLVNDVTTGTPVGIHVEPGLWMVVPPTTIPQEVQTVVRMASIPHGTTIEAQGTTTTINGPPNIPRVDITPFFDNGRGQVPGNTVTFPSQQAAAQGTARIPQDLTSFINNGTITQNILDDPNSLLRNNINNPNIIKTIQISINTNPSPPLIGGGQDNIAFLLGDVVTGHPNAQTTQMSATFWIETVQETITIPIFKPGQAPLLIKGIPRIPNAQVPTFSVEPPFEIKAPIKIKVTFTQIQYSQIVFLRFGPTTPPLIWPHVSVSTLIPAGPVTVPPSAWQ